MNEKKNVCSNVFIFIFFSSFQLNVIDFINEKRLLDSRKQNFNLTAVKMLFF